MINKIIVITGGTSGIGQALKHKFEKNSNIVYALSRNNEGNENNFILCDVTIEEQINFALNEIAHKHKKIDMLINCAGYGLYGATELLESKEVKKQMDTNFLGTYLMTKYTLKYMQSGGKIINISSACAIFPLPYRNIYCASKAAVSSYSNGLKMELKPLNIDVTSICPGDIKTPFTKNRVKCFETNEKYKDRIEKASEKVENNNSKRMELDYSTDKMFKIINKTKYKPEYIIGTKYKILNFLMKFFPKNLYLNIVEKHFGGHK